MRLLDKRKRLSWRSLARALVGTDSSSLSLKSNEIKVSKRVWSNVDGCKVFKPARRIASSVISKPSKAWAGMLIARMPTMCTLCSGKLEPRITAKAVNTSES
ncbi:somatotropin [Trichinella spiralis]|uniref:somatotropin n=1 Tax=Trichinella spiralis TaxID=6334 RepID=UPI0001EFC5C2|nr:somatotropin [Trichinella spiralis]